MAGQSTAENRKQIGEAIMNDLDRMKGLVSKEELRTIVVETEFADEATRNLARLRLNERGDALPSARSNLGVSLGTSLKELRMKSAVHRRAVEAWAQVQKYEKGTWAGTAEECVELAFKALETSDTAPEFASGPNGGIARQYHSRFLHAIASVFDPNTENQSELKGKALYVLTNLALLDEAFGDPLELIDSAINEYGLTRSSAIFQRSVCLAVRGDVVGALPCALEARKRALGDPGLVWSYTYPIAKAFFNNGHQDDARREFTQFVDATYDPELRKTLGGREEDPYEMGKVVDGEYFLSYLLLCAQDTTQGGKRFEAAAKREADLPVEALKTITEIKFIAQSMLTRLPTSTRTNKALAAGSQGRNCLECHHCKQVPAAVSALKPCPCKLVSYCGDACSKAAWAEHKKVCAFSKAGKKGKKTTQQGTAAEACCAAALDDRKNGPEEGQAQEQTRADEKENRGHGQENRGEKEAGGEVKASTAAKGATGAGGARMAGGKRVSRKKLGHLREREEQEERKREERARQERQEQAASRVPP